MTPQVTADTAGRHLRELASALRRRGVGRLVARTAGLAGQMQWLGILGSAAAAGVLAPLYLVAPPAGGPPASRWCLRRGNCFHGAYGVALIMMLLSLRRLSPDRSRSLSRQVPG